MSSHQVTEVSQHYTTDRQSSGGRISVLVGYKQTEIGVIPEEWEATTLGEIAEVRMCKRVLSGQTRKTGDIPFYKIGTFGSQPDAYISTSLYNEFKAKYSFPEKGDILISAAGTLGKAVVYDGEPAYFQDSNIVWLEVNKRTILNEFLYHYYKVMVWASPEGSTISRLYNGIIRASAIALPPLPEQRAIAAALSDVDALIASLEKIIAKKCDIKTATMQRLLTGEQRLPGFSGKWATMTIGALGQTYGGLTGKTKNDFGHGEARYIPFMNIMTNTVIDHNWVEPVKITSSESQNLVRKGDLFFNGSSETPDEVGFCSVLNEDVDNLYLNSFCFGFRFHNDAKVNGLFFAYWFRSQSGRKAMSILAQGATRYNIAKSAFMRLEIPQPSEEEQTEIANVLSDMDNEIAALESRLEKTCAIKQGMMQELLTGRTRLV